MFVRCSQVRREFPIKIDGGIVSQGFE
jgi:hypothetical protein